MNPNQTRPEKTKKMESREKGGRKPLQTKNKKKLVHQYAIEESTSEIINNNNNNNIYGEKKKNYYLSDREQYETINPAAL